jgi:hypothetical protein
MWLFLSKVIQKDQYVFVGFIAVTVYGPFLAYLEQP